MSLEDQISDIRTKLRNNEYQNEQSISQGVILRLLSEMKWPVYDTQLVIPEYNINGKRVDFALCTQKNKPVIFIEVKQQGNIVGADRQLFEYAFHIGVPFAIVTDGKEWHFYLPAEVGNYDERRVYKLDLIERDIHESAYILERYLSFNEVKHGKALENARHDYKNVSKERQAKANIPIAWGKLIEEKDEMLVEVISEKVESICGFKPSQKQIITYLRSLKSDVVSQQSADTKKEKSIYSPPSSPPIKQLKTSSRTKIKVSFPDGIEICYPKVADTMVEAIRKIGFKKVQSLNIRNRGLPLVSNEKLKEGTYNWSDTGSGFFISTHSSTDDKFDQLNKIKEGLGLNLKIEKL